MMLTSALGSGVEPGRVARHVDDDGEGRDVRSLAADEADGAHRAVDRGGRTGRRDVDLVARGDLADLGVVDRRVHDVGVGPDHHDLPARARRAVGAACRTVGGARPHCPRHRSRSLAPRHLLADGQADRRHRPGDGRRQAKRRRGSSGRSRETTRPRSPTPRPYRATTPSPRTPRRWPAGPRPPPPAPGPRSRPRTAPSWTRWPAPAPPPPSGPALHVDGGDRAGHGEVEVGLARRLDRPRARHRLLDRPRGHGHRYRRHRQTGRRRRTRGQPEGEADRRADEDDGRDRRWASDSAARPTPPRWPGRSRRPAAVLR